VPRDTTRNDGAGHLGVAFPSRPHPLLVCARWRVAPGCLWPASRAHGPDGATQQQNTHIRDIREVCYSWHPWHGRPVWVHATLIKRGHEVAHCRLEGVQTSRVLEVPLWMLDAAGCCKTRVSFRPHDTGPSPIAPITQPRYLLHAGGADGSIGDPGEIEPTSIVGSSAMQPALDESVVRCSTKDRAIAGAVTETA